MFRKRYLNPTTEQTIRGRVAGWIATMRARRVVATVLIATAIGGTTFACRASEITAPDFTGSAKGGISKTLVSDGGLISSDEDSDSWPMQPASHRRMTPEEAENDEAFRTSVETTFPVTQAVYNVCRNEVVVLNGFLKERMRIDAEPLGSLKFRLQTFKDTRGVAGSAEVQELWDHDNDPNTPPETRVRLVRYHNKESVLDKFEVGPAEAPFRSEFISKMFLEREGPDPLNYVKQVGDDLFVFVRQIVKIDNNGQTVMKNEFRTECK